MRLDLFGKVFSLILLFMGMPDGITSFKINAGNGNFLFSITLKYTLKNLWFH